MSHMSELDIRMQNYEKEIAALKKQNAMLKQELYEMTVKKNEMAKIATQGIVTVKGVKN